MTFLASNHIHYLNKNYNNYLKASLFLEKRNALFFLNLYTSVQIMF